MSDFTWVFVLIFESSSVWPGAPHVEQASLELAAVLLFFLPAAGIAGVCPHSRPSVTSPLEPVPPRHSQGDSMSPLHELWDYPWMMYALVCLLEGLLVERQ